MGNKVCKKCKLPIDSHLLSQIEERRHCLVHNTNEYGCKDCDNENHTHCYHKFSYSLF